MTDIAELFARDPLELSDQDIDTIILKFREQRGQYNMGNAMAGSTKPKSAKAAQIDKLAAANAIDLSDLL